ncbi:MBL fold metallo-hydrolase [Candidatus Pacearchaeota archaeon ex4484_26]|nr:MAG: MBL fold metallo-hydrolase [Candidatus Pacearchaeota archaeon ex4484_26]
MKVKKFILVIIVILLIIALFGIKIKMQKVAELGQGEEIEMGKELTKMRNVSITTIYDNYQYNPGLKTGWGFSCLVKTENITLLFDTGGDSETLLSNMEKLKILPSEVDIIVLSHIHGDHTGGLKGFLEKNSKVKVYLPKSFPSSFKTDVESEGATAIDVHEPIEIEKGTYTTGELGVLIKEQSLIINTEKGIIVITGCAHPGIVNIVRKAKEITNENIYLVLGGFHLGGVSDSNLKSIIADFRKLGVEKVAPCHCSGDRCRELFKEEYKDNFISNGVGKIIEI